MKKNLRIQFDLPEEKVKSLDALMEQTGIRTRRELFNNALAMFEWAVHRSARGYEVSAYNENTSELHVLNTPALSIAYRPVGLSTDRDVAEMATRIRETNSLGEDEETCKE